MKIVIALGGNALMRPDQEMTIANQRERLHVACASLAPLAQEHELVITHGNGPQVGLLAQQSSIATPPRDAATFDILDAESEGMIGYMLEQELGNRLDKQDTVATLLTQVEVSPDDPAFWDPTKPIGAFYNKAQAKQLTDFNGWILKPVGDKFRRFVSSPKPLKVMEINVIRLLLSHGITVICAGGGGIPVVRREDDSLMGVSAVIDKDLTSAMLAQQLEADMLLMLTDVDAVRMNWKKPNECGISEASPQELNLNDFEEGSMRPKVEAAIGFATATDGVAAIGSLERAVDIVKGYCGTRFSKDYSATTLYAEIDRLHDGEYYAGGAQI